MPGHARTNLSQIAIFEGGRDFPRPRLSGPIYGWITCLCSGVPLVTPGPLTRAQPEVPAPPAHPHQFCVALTVPVPRLSMPIPFSSKLFRCTWTFAPVFTATL